MGLIIRRLLGMAPIGQGRCRVRPGRSTRAILLEARALLRSVRKISFIGRGIKNLSTGETKRLFNQTLEILKPSKFKAKQFSTATKIDLKPRAVYSSKKVTRTNLTLLSSNKT